LEFLHNFLDHRNEILLTLHVIRQKNNYTCDWIGNHWQKLLLYTLQSKIAWHKYATWKCCLVQA